MMNSFSGAVKGHKELASREFSKFGEISAISTRYRVDTGWIWRIPRTCGPQARNYADFPD
jgi:hypothetical protein